MGEVRGEVGEAAEVGDRQGAELRCRARMVGRME